jgi:alkane 1-monooxygenase
MATAGLCLGGWWAWLTPAFVFLAIPLIDWLLGVSDDYADRVAQSGSENSMGRPESAWWSRDGVYTGILIFQVASQLSLLVVLGHYWTTQQAEVWERVGWVLSVALSVGGVGITVAHELVHRQVWWQRGAGKLMLMGVLYMHFSIEHVRGHHASVGTSEDAASAPRGMNVYRFLVRTVPLQWWSAWGLECKRLGKHGRAVWSHHNEMLWFLIFQLLWLGLLTSMFGFAFLPVYLVVATLSFGLLEVVNYIEHYGLRREKGENGRYEAVGPEHSWNSNHRLSRALLFELSRHSDHHLHALKHYQRLANGERSPQLPSGYPGMVLLALVPPVWFWMMDRRIEPQS